MNLKRREKKGVIILDLEGKILGGEEAESLRRAINEVIEKGTPQVLFNLKHVPWMNSSGLGVLLSSYLRVIGKGGAAKFLNVQERVRGILTTTKLIHVLEVFDDEEKAIDSYSGNGPQAAEGS